MAADEQLNGRVTLRDLARVEAGQEKILAEIEKLAMRVDARFETHVAKHEAEKEAHATKHEAERRELRGLIRGLMMWAVTTIIPAIGVVIAIYAATKD